MKLVGLQTDIPVNPVSITTVPIVLWWSGGFWVRITCERDVHQPVADCAYFQTSKPCDCSESWSSGTRQIISVSSLVHPATLCTSAQLLKRNSIRNGRPRRTLVQFVHFGSCGLLFKIGREFPDSTPSVLSVGTRAVDLRYS